MSGETHAAAAAVSVSRSSKHHRSESEHVAVAQIQSAVVERENSLKSFASFFTTASCRFFTVEFKQSITPTDEWLLELLSMAREASYTDANIQAVLEAWHSIYEKDNIDPFETGEQLCASWSRCHVLLEETLHEQEQARQQEIETQARQLVRSLSRSSNASIPTSPVSVPYNLTSNHPKSPYSTAFPKNPLIDEEEFHRSRKHQLILPPRPIPTETTAALVAEQPPSPAATETEEAADQEGAEEEKSPVTPTATATYSEKVVSEEEKEAEEIAPSPRAALQGFGSSPGRLDFMGGVSDYSGGLVLQMPLSNHCTNVTLKYMPIKTLERSMEQQQKEDDAEALAAWKSTREALLKARAKAESQGQLHRFLDTQNEDPLVSKPPEPSTKIQLSPTSVFFHSFPSPSSKSQHSSSQQHDELKFLLVDGNEFMEIIEASWEEQKELFASPTTTDPQNHAAASQQSTELTHVFLHALAQLCDMHSLPRWVKYIWGSILAAIFEIAPRYEFMLQPIEGHVFCVEVSSNLPQGAGAASSAAIEVASMKALLNFANQSHTAQYGPPSNDMAYYGFEGTTLARLAQAVENLVVGASCGLMDQLAVAYGEPGELLPILCRPDQIRPPIALPPGVVVIGWHSGVQHEHAGDEKKKQQSSDNNFEEDAAPEAKSGRPIDPSPYAVARTASEMSRVVLNGLVHKLFSPAVAKALPTLDQTSAIDLAMLHRVPPPPKFSPLTPSSAASSSSSRSPSSLSSSSRRGSSSSALSVAAAAAADRRPLIERIPVSIFGASFMSLYNNSRNNIGGTFEVHPALAAKISFTCNYPLRAALTFPIEETKRCEKIWQLLREIQTEASQQQQQNQEAVIEAKQHTTPVIALSGSALKANRATIRAKSAARISRLINHSSLPSTLLLEHIEKHLHSIGMMMYESHQAYSDLGLGHAMTDKIVQAIQMLSRHRSGVYGARISGGGSGGTVVILCRKEAVSEIRTIADSMARGKALILT